MLRSGLIATKIGNSSFYQDNGTNTQVTVLKVDECIVSGVKTIEKTESLTIYGSKVVGGCSIDSELDHRIAMSFLILGLISKEPIKVLRTSTIDTSFPNFYKIMKEIGANFTKG